MKPCWSCGAQDAPCDESICVCAKCEDPEGYAEWRANYPDEYDDWLESQMEEDGW